MKLSARNRRAIATGALVTAVAGTLVAASIVSRQFFEGPSRNTPPHHPQVAPAVPALTLFRVASIEGAVEALHNGQWYVVQAGDLLPLQDIIRTNKAAKALLRRGSTEIEVREDVDIRLDKLAQDTASLAMLRGNAVVASVEAPNEAVEITAGGTRSQNKGPSRWVVEQGVGGVTVGTIKGEVLFSARDKQVTVRAGQESTARPDEPPSEPEAIPEELLLSVMWPELEHSEAQAQLQGKVRSSSRVKVNGVDAPVRADGRFAASVPLGVGPNKVEVEAQDILGRKKAVSKTLRRPPPSPTLEPTDEELWKR
jgi:Glucodextranase, domain B